MYTDDSIRVINDACERLSLDSDTIAAAWAQAEEYFGTDGADTEIGAASLERVLSLAETRYHPGYRMGILEDGGCGTGHTCRAAAASVRCTCTVDTRLQWRCGPCGGGGGCAFFLPRERDQTG